MRHARFCGPRTHGGKPYDGAGKVKIFKIKKLIIIILIYESLKVCFDHSKVYISLTPFKLK